MIFYALTIAPFVQTWLQNSSAVSVLHVFERVCNLVNERREVVSLVATEVGAGPFNVVVGLKRPFLQDVTVETAVSIEGSCVQLGGLAIETAQATLWNPQPAWHKIGNWQPPLFPLSTLQSLISDLPATHELLNALAAQNTADFQLAVSGLAGLGEGLTPAGDDFLMGVLHGLWATRPGAEAAQWGQIMVETAVPCTTTLSAAWLKAAARGEAGQVWHELVGEQYSVDSTQYSVDSGQWGVNSGEAVGKILGIGHTSGAAAWAGFTAVFNLFSRF